MLFKKSPYHYWHRYLNPEAKQSEPTPAMIMGELVHTMVLEPLLVNERYSIAPEINRRTKAGKEEWAAFQEESESKKVVIAEFAEKATKMAKACKDNEVIESLLDGALVERSIYFKHKETGIKCKARPDAFSGSMVVDLKTSADASYRAFQSSMMKFGYHLQAGMLHEALKSVGVKMSPFVFVVVENVEPYATAVYKLDEYAIEHGVSMFNSLMQKYADLICDKDYLDGGKLWPSYEIQMLTLPKWAEFEEL